MLLSIFNFFNIRPSVSLPHEALITPRFATVGREQQHSSWPDSSPPRLCPDTPRARKNPKTLDICNRRNGIRRSKHTGSRTARTRVLSQRSWNSSHDSEAMASRCDAVSRCPCCCCSCCCDDDALIVALFVIDSAVTAGCGCEVVAVVGAAGEAGRVNVGEVFGPTVPAVKTWQPRAVESARTSFMINQLRARRAG